MKLSKVHTSLRTSTTRSSRIESNSTISRIKGNRTRSKGKNKTLQGKVRAHTVVRTMKQLNVVRPRELVLDVGLWTMPFEIAHNYRIKALGISYRGKQLLRIRHQLRIRQDHLSRNSSKAGNRLRIRMFVLHSSSSRTEMHKGGIIGHSNKDVHTISTVLMQRLRVM